MTKTNLNYQLFIALFVLFFQSVNSLAEDYHVGPDETLTSIGEVPWTTLEAGDHVYIHWRDSPYREKWVINRKGTAAEPIKISGILGPDGQLPVIEGDEAVTVPLVDYWNESRGVIKIGGSSIPEDGLPEYIIIENLEIKSARPGYSFTNDHDGEEEYSSNAAAIYIEKGKDITIRNCIMHDSGNGLFIGANGGLTQNILVEKNSIFNNGIEGSQYEHNAYTAAINITFQYNHFGPLREGAFGNNLKDRSAGTVVRYNWIKGGSRLIDLVDAEDSEVLVDHPSYATTHVYGNVLIKPQAAGNSQVVHYGGDSGTYDDYRKGDLYFYNNTVISTRDGNTTLINLSTNEETMHLFNNVLYSTASGNHFALINNNGVVNMNNNWIKPSWKVCHCTPEGVINDLGDNIEEKNPLFENFEELEFRPTNTSSLVNNGADIPAVLMADHDVEKEYDRHQEEEARYTDGSLDIGAYENTFGLNISSESLENELFLFPNPAKSELNIQAKESFEYIVVNAIGEQVLNGKSTGFWHVLSIESLPKGIYYIQFINNGNNRTEKFIKL